MRKSPQTRVPYIDWLRGLACLVMFQTHCYDSWLGGSARQGSLMSWSQLGGTLPAPLFLFLSGVSLAILTDSSREKGISATQTTRRVVLRGAEIFALALAFRLQEFLLGQPRAPWTDLFRVDILNVIGISIILMGITCGAVARLGATGLKELRHRDALAAAAVGLLIAMLTPPLWTTWQPHWSGWWLESYIDGVHTFGTPQPWLFPLFPWAAFAFAGLAAGLLLRSDWLRRNEAAVPLFAGAAGAALVALGYTLDASRLRIYAEYDFWHTSPNFFLMRVGVVLLVLMGGYYWCRWTGAGRRFSPLIEMGRCSLLVYWVHIEFVYGRFSILPKHGAGIAMASVGLAVIFVCAVLLAAARNRFPDWRAVFSAPPRQPVGAQSHPE